MAIKFKETIDYAANKFDFVAKEKIDYAANKFDFVAKEKIDYADNKFSVTSDEKIDKLYKRTQIIYDQMETLSSVLVFVILVVVVGVVWYVKRGN